MPVAAPPQAAEKIGRSRHPKRRRGSKGRSSSSKAANGGLCDESLPPTSKRYRTAQGQHYECGAAWKVACEYASRKKVDVY